jgi:Zn ribbon nucleic-acid-binding protein
MLNRKLSAGDIIDARCTRCREILNHRIVAMVEDKVVRVECNTCGGVHNYYPPPTAKEARVQKLAKTSESSRPSSSRVSKKDPHESDREEWASLRPTIQIDRAVDYDMNGSYRVNALLNHSVFGLGFVKNLIAPNKMQVLFQDGIKLLRCQ